MSRRSSPLLPLDRDGTSQAGRRLPALDPSYAPIDQRTDADLLAFVQAYAAQLRYFRADASSGEVRPDGTWADFVSAPDVSLADVAAYLEDPTRFSGETARWLGRPHFVLLLTLIKLLGHARNQLNGFTRRHLDHFYRDILGVAPRPPVPDRATVILQLRPKASETRIPAGTALLAGKDAAHVPRVYRTERDIVVNHATVGSLRSLYVDRRTTTFADVRCQRALTEPAARKLALDGMLRLALGAPRPGDLVPPWNNSPLAIVDFIQSLHDLLDFARTGLFAELDELRSLMRLYRRRTGPDATPEWDAINELLGVKNPVNPRDFEANFQARVGVLDFAQDGLPQVNSLDDLYAFRSDAKVRDYIDNHLGGLGFDAFVDVMRRKACVDRDWAEINRILQQMGTRQRGVLEWVLPASKPTDFDGNLAAALQGHWPPNWPWGTHSLVEYEALLRNLEDHFGMSTEQLRALSDFARAIDSALDGPYDWAEIDRILSHACREKRRVQRRAALARIRETSGAPSSPATFDAVVNFVLAQDAAAAAAAPSATLVPWAVAATRLAPQLSKAQLDYLNQFRDCLVTRMPLSAFSWTDALEVLELAWRKIAALPEDEPKVVELHNVYAYDDAAAAQGSGGSTDAWATFGSVPTDAREAEPRGASLGWQIRSPLLALSEGQRTITLTWGLRSAGFDPDAFWKILGLPVGADNAALAKALNGVLAIQVSTAKGWLDLAPTTARLARGGKNDDYWTLTATQPSVPEARPALQLTFALDVTQDALAPVKGDDESCPALRVTLRPRWDGDGREWRLPVQAFEPMRLAAVHLKVDVQGLSALRLQQDDRVLDARKPFEPFGNRPAVGARFYVSHPELVRTRLDSLQFNVEWMGLPKSLKVQYTNYPERTSASVFRTQLRLVDRGAEIKLADKALFEVDANNTSEPVHTSSTLPLPNLPDAIRAAAPLFVYAGCDWTATPDVRTASRYFVWELAPIDFGHFDYPALTAAKSRALAVDIAKNSIGTPDSYQVLPPYTPTIKRLTVAYSASVQVDPTAPSTEHRLSQVHPFGHAPLDPVQPTLIPAYPLAGELYIGLRDVKPPQNVTLLMQLAEGTSDPNAESAGVTWSYLTGDRFEELKGGGVVNDPTRGWINSGVVELALPPAAPSTRLPPGYYWLRLATAQNPRAVCDTVAIRAQAVAVCFEDRGNSPAHYARPLPAGSIDRLVDPNAAIAKVEQPYTSAGGKPAEEAASFDLRVSERLRHKQRALTLWDYERLVLQNFSQIYKAKCLPTESGVDVVVIPDIRASLATNTFAPMAPANLLADIQQFLSERAPETARVRVRNAQYVPVQIRLGVRFQPGVDAAYAQQRLNDDLVRFLCPWAFDEGADLMIGGRIFANSILDFVDRREYVDYAVKIELAAQRSKGGPFLAVPPVAKGYCVATDGPDQVLVTAPQHLFDIVAEDGYQESNFSGINYMRIEFDFTVV